ncbi:PREDICTED: uncharacterized protein LOC108579137 [Habropoda laboriosa]|uniref:uncharacterized protein LOC108579137 n=1 Tax=Habropoda laboriosa TaxID=597456 RepID=UPI00083DBA77|nr:PREDICTED: uncharacterized protein LOC108579137 [Habropoda laboriosa]
MVSDSAKTLALIITAIKNLRELKGSTLREILHYLSSVHDVPSTTARRQIQTALKRGVAYGFLKKTGDHYILPMSDDLKCQEIAEQEVNLLDVCRKNKIQRKLGCKCKKKRRKRRKRKRRFCRCKKKTMRRRRRKRSRGCGRRRRRRRRKRKCKCGGLGSRRDRNRGKRCGPDRLQPRERYSKERYLGPAYEAYDSAASQRSSVSTISSMTD